MILIIIPAKGHSNRLPNKNMHPVNGRPMIAYALDEARRSKKASAVIVSTDDDVIESYCVEQNVKVVRRPHSLGGETPIIDVYRHAVSNFDSRDEVTIIVGLQVDHPDRSVSVDGALAIFERERADCLNSTDKEGLKNGAHYIFTAEYLKSGLSHKPIVIQDHCSNIHTIEELREAEKALESRI